MQTRWNEEAKEAAHEMVLPLSRCMDMDVRVRHTWTSESVFPRIFDTFPQKVLPIKTQKTGMQKGRVDSLPL